MEKNSIIDLFFETNLRHLYQAEKAVAENLVTLADHASSEHLQNIFRTHREETLMQIDRLEEIFGIFDIDPSMSKLQGLPDIKDQAKELLKTLVDLNFTDRSKGIDGILAEGKELLRHFAKTDANEIALICAAKKVEHYEIASYSFLAFLAIDYKNKRAVDLLKESLHEEVEMERRISEFAQHNLHIQVAL